MTKDALLPEIFPRILKEAIVNPDKHLKQWSGWRDLNSRPLRPEPNPLYYNTFKPNSYRHFIFPFMRSGSYSVDINHAFAPQKGGE